MEPKVRPVYDDQRTKFGALVTISHLGLRRRENYKRPWLQPGRQKLRTDEAMLQIDDQLTSQTRRILQPMLITRSPMLKTDNHRTATAVLGTNDLKKPSHSKILNYGFVSFDSGAEVCLCPHHGFILPLD
jgi:hypothetical protein